MKPFRIPWLLAISLLVWSSNVGCKKEPKPDCWDGSCCDEDKNRYRYVEYLENVPADLSGPPVFSGWGVLLKTPVPTGAQRAITAIQLCSYCVDKIQGLKPTFTGDPAIKPVYQYRVWGKALEDTLSTSFTGLPVIFFYIDKIEKNQ